MTIDAEGVHYRQLNEQIHAALRDGNRDLAILNVRGQRYIGVGLSDGARIAITGVPGNDLGAFMNGARITVSGNAQDGVGNTMNAGAVVVDGDAGDVVGYAMRGGRILVRGNVGYRAGIHMKAYGDSFPVIVVGGTAKEYLGEYMAGGIIVVLNRESPDSPPAGEHIGTGMHGGAIYLRGPVEPHQLGKEVGVGKPDGADREVLRRILDEYAAEFGLGPLDLGPDDLTKLTPQSARPYGRLYAY